VREIQGRFERLNEGGTPARERTVATGRRRFLRWTLGGAAGAMLTGPVRAFRAAPEAAGDPWLDAIAGRKHKAFLDVGYFGVDGAPFRRTRALMATLKERYGAADTSIGVAFGAHSSGLGYMMTPAAWTELGLVELVAGLNLRTADVQVLRSGAKNWGSVGADAVAELRERGVRFLACGQTIEKWAERIASSRGGSAPDVAAKIRAGLHAGVEQVPAMIAAAVVAQGRGVGYVAVG
jgi:hypothetical protein